MFSGNDKSMGQTDVNPGSSKIWTLLCLVCTMFALTVMIALSIGITEPIETIHVGAQKQIDIVNPEEVKNEALKNAMVTNTFLAPKYTCDDCINLNGEALDQLAKEGLQMEVGQKQTLFVTENPSTGYRWLIESKKIADSNVIKITEKFTQKSMIAPKTGPNVVNHPMIGRAGSRIFTVEATKEGTFSFRAANARSWEFPGFDKYNGRQMHFDINVKKP